LLICGNVATRKKIFYADIFLMTETYWIKKQSQDLFDKALELESEGKTDEAVVSYQESLRVNPKNSQALYNLGIAYATLNKLDQAISCWRRAIWLEPRFRDELVKAFAVDDELSETVIGEDYPAYIYQKAA
jgi:tetratricopeptide (TPR) repeat protein